MRYGGSNPPLCTISFRRDWLLKVAVTGECCGSKPGRQRKDEHCADCTGSVGGSGLAHDGARQVSVPDMDPVRIFCLPRHTRMDAFAVGL